MSFGMGLASTADIYGPSAGSTFYQGQEKAPSTASAIAGSPGSPTAAGAPSIASKNMLPGVGNVNPLLWIPLLLGVVVLLKLLREWGTKREEFATLRVDAYWFVMTTLAAAVGIPFLKGMLNKYHVPGLTEYINNA